MDSTAGMIVAAPAYFRAVEVAAIALLAGAAVGSEFKKSRR
jgi:hypothetical protein